MALVYHPLSPPLSNYIDRLYYIDGQMPYQREKILPCAWLDLKINVGGAIKGYALDSTEAFALTDSWSVGLWNKYHVVDWPTDTQFFGVFFKPGGVYPFFQMPIAELHNRVVSLDMIWGSAATEIRQRLQAAPTIQAALGLLEKLLLNRLCEPPSGYKAVQYALTEIARQHGVLSIRDLCEQIGISQSHLITLFKLFVGGTPKELARLYRFQHILDHLSPMQPVDWTLIAHQAQYYDQSHFNKDFMAFTGHNPTDYLRLRRQVHDENPQHARFLRELPTD